MTEFCAALPAAPYDEEETPADDDTPVFPTMDQRQQFLNQGQRYGVKPSDDDQDDGPSWD
jgi:hypothetical protein